MWNPLNIKIMESEKFMKNEKTTTKESLWERQQNFRNFVAARSTGKFKRKGVKK